MTKSVHLAVVDTSKDCLAAANINVVWNDFSSDPTIISLSTYVETHAERLRMRFADFVEDVSNHEIEGRQLTELLLVRKDFSYWWMTLFASTRWNENSNITNCLKLIALSEILTEHQVSQLTINISHQQSALVLTKFAKNHNIAHNHISASTENESAFILRIKALISLFKYAITHIGVSNVSKNTDSRITIVDHFVRFERGKATEGIYDSQYWNALSPIFDSQTSKLMWLHHFVPNTASIRGTEKLISNLNEPSKSFHAQFETRLTFKTFTRVWRDLGSLRKASRIIEQNQEIFTEKISQLDFAPLFTRQFNESLLGSTAARHLIMLSQQETLFRRLPRQNKGLFLCENQPWEAAFTYAWKSHGHGELIAVTHAPLRFWDFRYFTLGRALRSKSSQPCDKPVPDYIAVNSKISLNFLNACGAPSKSVVEVESLMFDYLQNSNSISKIDSNIMLLIGDFFPEQNERLISIVASTLSSLTTKFKVIFKPHPLNSVMPDLSRIPGAETSWENLNALLPRTGVTVSCNSSTAALESYAYGIRTISLLDPQVLNSSPLRSIPHAHFVENSEQLSHALAVNDSDQARDTDLLIMDPALPRWRKLLS